MLRQAQHERVFGFGANGKQKPFAPMEHEVRVEGSDGLKICVRIPQLGLSPSVGTNETIKITKHPSINSG